MQTVATLAFAAVSLAAPAWKTTTRYGDDDTASNYGYRAVSTTSSWGGDDDYSYSTSASSSWGTPTSYRCKGNNGYGNGDQCAPGNSRYNNNAENKGDGPNFSKNGKFRNPNYPGYPVGQYGQGNFAQSRFGRYGAQSGASRYGAQSGASRYGAQSGASRYGYSSRYSGAKNYGQAKKQYGYSGSSYGYGDDATSSWGTRTTASSSWGTPSYRATASSSWGTPAVSTTSSWGGDDDYSYSTSASSSWGTPTSYRCKGNNGYGNGDQCAPGNSRYNNNAENKGDGPNFSKNGKFRNPNYPGEFPVGAFGQGNFAKNSN